MTTKWIFEDSPSGIRAVFDSEKEAKTFMNHYRTYMYKEYECEFHSDDLMVYEYYYNPKSPEELIKAEET